jgi:hypothetical protein
MRLDDYCGIFDSSRFPRRGMREHPERDSVLAARNILTDAIACDEFLADCISFELDRIESEREQWGLDPFFTIPDLGIRFAFGYWPPGGTPGPHEHTAWTITAVCRNELEVLTYDRDESYRRRDLVLKNRFEAPAGRTGFIYDPCIHEPRNVSGDWSLSIHILSPRDGEELADYDQCIPALVTGLPGSEGDHPYVRVAAVRRRRRFVHLLARILSTMEVQEAPRLLARCHGLASRATRLLIERVVQPPVRDDAAGAPWVLTREHGDLVLGCRDDGEMVVLHAETPRGMVEELRISNQAREAIGFIARETTFDVGALPGGLSREERMAIAESLEDTGLFRRVKQ